MFNVFLILFLLTTCLVFVGGKEKKKVIDDDVGLEKRPADEADVSIVVLVHSGPVYVRSLVRSLRRRRPSWAREMVLVEFGPLDLHRRDALEGLAAGDEDGWDAGMQETDLDHLHVKFDREQPETLTLFDAVRAGLSQTSGSTVLLIHDCVELFHNAPVNQLAKRLAVRQTEGLVAVSGLLLDGDNRTVAHAGIDFAFARAPEPRQDYYYQSGGDGGAWDNVEAEQQPQQQDEDLGIDKDPSGDVAVPYYVLRGASSLDRRIGANSVGKGRWVQSRALSSAFLLVHRQRLAAAVNKAPPLHSLGLAEAALSLILLENGGADGAAASTSNTRLETFTKQPLGVMYERVPSPFQPDDGSSSSNSLLSSGSDEKDHAQLVRDAVLFEQRWGRRLRAQLKQAQDPDLAQVRLTWNMDCGLGAVLGFTSEAINIVTALERRLDVRVDVSDRHQCQQDLRRSGLPAHKVDAVLRMLGKVETPASDQTKRILVIHRDPGRYSAFGWSTTSDYKIGRSMFETDSVPSDWPDKCNTDVDEVWVPSQFNVQTFSRAGVLYDRLHVIPEPVDVHVYDSDAVHAPLLLATLPGLEIRGAGVGTDDDGGGGGPGGQRDNDLKAFTASTTAAAALALLKQTHFNFLAVGKWEQRKGYDLLLQAWAAGFRDGDGAALWLLCRLNNQEDRDAFNQAVNQAAESAGVPVTELAPVFVINRLLPFSHLPALYKSVNAVVSATHGEGWGLPLAEAMAMGLPVLATNYSGLTSFLDETAGWPIPYELTDVSNSDHRWASVSVPSLTEAMVAVANGERQHPGGSPIDPRARALQFSGDRVADRIVDRLRTLVPTVERRTNPVHDWTSNNNDWGNYYFNNQANSNNDNDQNSESDRISIKIND